MGWSGIKQERERERETDLETEKERARDRDTITSITISQSASTAHYDDWGAWGVLGEGDEDVVVSIRAVCTRGV